MYLIDHPEPLRYSKFVRASVDKILSEALKLPPEARAFVAEKLIESLDVEPDAAISPAWREEVRKRCREIDAGLVRLRDAQDVFATAFAAVR
jgi:hypothetical protein